MVQVASAADLESNNIVTVACIVIAVIIQSACHEKRAAITVAVIAVAVTVFHSLCGPPMSIPGTHCLFFISNLPADLTALI